jgi:AcrR family transcriptional regulator
MSFMSQPSPESERPGSESKRAAQGRATREQLIEVATRLFAERGYEDTSIEAVLAAAGVSRGALYHHFAGKDALFEAVLQSVDARIFAQLTAAISEVPDAFAKVETASLMWIGMARDPVIQRIVLLDAPSVLGADYWRGEGEMPAVGAMRQLLQPISDDGHLAPDLVDPFARMILAALDELAVVIARADDPEEALASARVAVRELLRRLLS